MFPEKQQAATNSPNKNLPHLRLKMSMQTLLLIALIAVGGSSLEAQTIGLDAIPSDRVEESKTPTFDFSLITTMLESEAKKLWARMEDAPDTVTPSPWPPKLTKNKDGRDTVYIYDGNIKGYDVTGHFDALMKGYISHDTRIFVVNDSAFLPLSLGALYFSSSGPVILINLPAIQEDVNYHIYKAQGEEYKVGFATLAQEFAHSPLGGSANEMQSEVASFQVLGADHLHSRLYDIFTYRFNKKLGISNVREDLRTMLDMYTALIPQDIVDQFDVIQNILIPIYGQIVYASSGGVDATYIVQQVKDNIPEDLHSMCDIRIHNNEVALTLHADVFSSFIKQRIGSKYDDLLRDMMNTYVDKVYPGYEIK